MVLGDGGTASVTPAEPSRLSANLDVPHSTSSLPAHKLQVRAGDGVSLCAPPTMFAFLSNLVAFPNGWSGNTSVFSDAPSFILSFFLLASCTCERFSACSHIIKHFTFFLHSLYEIPVSKSKESSFRVRSQQRSCPRLSTRERAEMRSEALQVINPRSRDEA